MSTSITVIYFGPCGQRHWEQEMGSREKYGVAIYLGLLELDLGILLLLLSGP